MHIINTMYTHTHILKSLKFSLMHFFKIYDLNLSLTFIICANDFTVSGLRRDGRVPTMNNTTCKLFPLLVLPCLGDLLLIHHTTICTSRVHTSIRTDTPTRLPSIYSINLK